MDYPYSTFTTSRSYTYSYVHIKPQNPELPYILFLHGFPSSSYDWRHQVPYFAQKGYGIIAPDLLGFGNTSKPLNVEAYKLKSMSEDIVQVLKNEGISQVICVAHDWGSALASRLANYFPDLFLKIAFLDVGYMGPGHGLSTQTLHYINKSFKDSMGFELFGYFLFFAEEDAPELMGANVDSLQSMFYSTDNEVGKKYMGAVGGTRKWLTEGMVAEREEWLEPEAIEHNRKIFGKENGGYAASINWYRGQLQEIDADDEKAVPEANTILRKPVLYIGTDNFITAASDTANQMKAFVPDLKVRKLDAGHWVMLQKKAEVNGILGEFFQG